MLSDNLLEQLIDCREDEMPPAKTVQLMASEIMRFRSHGEMIPAPSDELKQRVVSVLVALGKHESLREVLKTVSERVKPETKVDIYSAFYDAMRYIAGDVPLGDEDDNWIEISSYLLQDSERVIQDAVGFGKSHGTKDHNLSLNLIHKYIQNSGSSSTVLVQKDFIQQVATTIENIVYGTQVSQAYREQIVRTLNTLLEDDSKKTEKHATDNAKSEDVND